jgi:hypothetical protein
MVELKIVLLELNLPVSGTGAYFMGLTLVHKIFMISPDDNRLIKGSGAEQVRPVAESMNDGKKFSIIDQVVHFGGSKCLGIVPNDA